MIFAWASSSVESMCTSEIFFRSSSSFVTSVHRCTGILDLADISEIIDPAEDEFAVV